MDASCCKGSGARERAAWFRFADGLPEGRARQVVAVPRSARRDARGERGLQNRQEFARIAEREGVRSCAEPDCEATERWSYASEAGDRSKPLR
jgi:hypothetical protein